MRTQRIVVAMKLCAVAAIATAALAVAASLLASGMVSSSVAHAGLPISVTVQPPAPTEADSVGITVTGVLPKPCFDVSSSHAVVGNVIHVVVNAVPNADFCVQVVVPFGVTEEIGKLAAGEYLVETTVYIPSGFPCGPLPCSDATTFEVVPVPVCPWDVNGDGVASLGDLALIALHWRHSASPPEDEFDQMLDLNNDGTVSLGDLAQVALRWREECPL